MTSRFLVVVPVIAVVMVMVVRLRLDDVSRMQWIGCGVAAMAILTLRTVWLLTAMRKHRKTMRYVRSAFL